MNKIKDIKAIFIDIDGTLTTTDRKVTEKTKEIIKRAVDNNIHAVLCSGRTNKYVCEYSKLALASNYAISCNGALVYDYENKKEIYKSTFDFLVFKKIWEYCIENQIGLVGNSLEIRYGNKFLDTDFESSKVVLDDIDTNVDIFQIVVESDNYDKMKNLKDFLDENLNLDIANMSHSFIANIKENTTYYFDIVNKDINKGVGINKFLEHINLTSDECICFGDHINDHSMFEVCKYKVAMGNSSEELKSISNFITSSNDDDGVASFLEKYLGV